MAQRYDLLTVREDKNGKSWWTKVGVAFEGRDGNSFSLMFEALPIPNKDGEVRVQMMVPRDKEDRREPAAPARRAPPAGERQSIIPEDDEIPF